MFLQKRKLPNFLKTISRERRFVIPSSIRTIGIQSNGNIITGGSFDQYKVGARNSNLVCLNEDAFSINATEEINHIPKFNNTVNTLVVQSDDKVIVAGAFTDYAGVIGRNRLIRLNSDGTLDTLFCQNASDNNKFDNLIFGDILALAVQPNGQILVGGQFTGYGDTSFNRLIRLNADGTLDVNFSQTLWGFNGEILSLVVQPNGQILVGGNFANYNNIIGRNFLVRLNFNGSVDEDFCSTAVDGKFNNVIRAIHIQSDGSILVGGDFTDYISVGRHRLIKIDSNGNLNTTFCQNASNGARFNGSITSIKTQSDGNILVGGSFSGYTYTGVNRLVRLFPNGTLDEAFYVYAVYNAKINGVVRVIEIQSDDKILVGGDFTDHGFYTHRNYLIRLESQGFIDTVFTNKYIDRSLKQAFNAPVRDIKEDSSKNIFIGGSFLQFGNELYRNCLLKFNKNGIIDENFALNAGNIFGQQIRKLCIRSDDKILVGGDFSNIDGVIGRNKLVLLNVNGSVNVEFCQNASDNYKFSDSVTEIAVQPNGQILVAGQFTNYTGTGSVSSDRLVRLNSDGTVDENFSSQLFSFNNDITSLQIQPNGQILVGGFFTNYGGVSGRNKLIRLNFNGSIDNDFCTSAVDGKFNDEVRSVNIQSTGQILVAGEFTDYGLVERSYLIRLFSDGTLDTLFCQNASNDYKFSNRIISMTVQSDDKIIVAGLFENYGENYGSTLGRNGLVRLNSNGSLDTNFCINAVDGSRINFIDGNIFYSSLKYIYIPLNSYYACGYDLSRFVDKLIRLDESGLPV